MISNNGIRAQGRMLSADELVTIQFLIDEHPDWSRHRVAKELCQRWEWRTPVGELKTFAARSLLLKLAERHQVQLPPVRSECRRVPWGLCRLEARPPAPCPPAESIESSLACLQPLQWEVAAHGSSERERALAWLRQYHYLGCNRPVGAHLIYLVRDAQHRDLAVHLIGAAAWQGVARDRYIGWSATARQASLHRIANHSRFLILPWVRVAHLASHLLAGLTRRVSSDWRTQHGWSLELLETFVEAGRFAGTAYQAAHWQEVGQTTGRTRQEKQHRAQAPRKSVWVYALEPGFRQGLGGFSSRGGVQ
jgi:hypothetical protein